MLQIVNLYSITLTFLHCILAREAQHADFFAGDYCLAGADLRQKHEFKTKLESAGVDFKAPTLFVCECVLVYMHVHQSHDLLKSLADWFDTAVFINYEQVSNPVEFVIGFTCS